MSIPSVKPNEPLKLHDKLLVIADSIEKVEKGGHNQKQNYSYTKAEDVIRIVRDTALKQGVLFQSKVDKIEVNTFQVNNRDSFLVTAYLDFCLTDGHESVGGSFAGQGWDFGDKALNKAYTSALKYFLLHYFFIPTGDDPEVVSEVDDDKGITQSTSMHTGRDGGTRSESISPVAAPSQRATGGLASEKQQKMLFAKAISAGVPKEKINDFFVENFGFPLKTLPWQSVTEAVERIQRYSPPEATNGTNPDDIPF